MFLVLVTTASTTAVDTTTAIGRTTAIDTTTATESVSTTGYTIFLVTSRAFYNHGWSFVISHVRIFAMYCKLCTLIPKADRYNLESVGTLYSILEPASMA